MTIRPILLVTLMLAAASAGGQPVAEDPCAEGQQYFQAHNYLAAEPLLQECLARGETASVLLPLTMITVIQGRAEEAAGYGERLVALIPDDANARFWYGRALVNMGNIDGALAQWEIGLAMDVSHVGILEGMSRVSMQRGETAKAYNLLSQLRLQGVDDAWIHRMLSELAYHNGLWHQSAFHFMDVVRREGESEANLLELGELIIRAGQPEEAVDVFQRAVIVSPSSATYGGLGAAWFAMDQVDSAVVALRMAVEMDPENARSRFNLANVLEILDRTEEADEHFAAYVELVPQDPLGQFNYGVHLERQGDMERGLARVEEAVRLDPNYLEAHVVLAQMYEAAGRTEDALRVLDSLGQLDPEATAQLEQWRRRLLGSEEEASVALAAGKVHIMHIITEDPEATRLVQEGIAAGDDFGGLATQYSTGATAVRGGDIGWVDPAQMVGELRTAIESLEPGATSPPVVTGGQTHFFKRIR